MAVSAVVLAILAGLPACTTAGTAPPVLGGPSVPGAEAVARVLVFSRTAGFRHDSIPTGLAVLRRELPTWGIEVDATEDPAAFEDANLARYAAVVFLNTTGDVLDDGQQAAFERYIGNGGAFVGVHSAADTEYEWPFYGELVGAYFTRHPLPFGMRIEVEDRNQLATGLLPRSFGLLEEIYDFDRNPRHDPATTVLMSVVDSYSLCDAIGGALVGPGCELVRVPSDFAMGADHPVAWQKEFRDGRSFYTNLGHMASTWARPEFVHHLVGGIRWAVGEDRRDQAFVVADRLASPTRIDVDDDGRVWILQKSGAVVVVDPRTGRRREVGVVPVNDAGEQGLLGIALAPGAGASGEVFLYGVEGDESPHGVLARYRYDEGGLDVGGREVLLTVPVDERSHLGGAVELDADGHLLLATGDNTNPFESSGYSPIDRREGRERFNALRTSANPMDLRGKVLRVRTDGSVPPGNLFRGDGDGRPEIFAMGLRNPFSLATSGDGRRFVADVGPDAVVDGTLGPKGFDEVSLLDGPGDHGWPRCVGARRPYADRDFATGRVGARFDCSGTESPLLAYAYLGVEEWALSDGGRTAIAGEVLDPEELTGPFAPPSRLAGTLLMSEWSRSRILALTIDDQGRLVRAERLFPHLDVRALDLDIGPDGALYALEYGTGGATGRVLRIEHVADGGQRPALAVSAEPEAGPDPLTVRLEAGASTVAPGDRVAEVRWDVDGDGTVDHTGEVVEVTLSGGGPRQVTATAVSVAGRHSLPATLALVVGNRPPTVAVSQDPPGPVASGATVTYRATVVDPEDGDSATDPTLCDRIDWQVSLSHNNHQHPTASQQGGCVLVSTVTLDDAHAPGASLGWAVRARYTDGGGSAGAPVLSATAEVAAPYGSGSSSDPLAALPPEVRGLLDILAQNPPLEDAVRSLDWYSFLTGGWDGYFG